MFQCFQVDTWHICHYLVGFVTYKFNVASPYLKAMMDTIAGMQGSYTLLPKEDRWPLAMSMAFHISFSPVDPMDSWQYNKSYCL